MSDPESIAPTVSPAIVEMARTVALLDATLTLLTLERAVHAGTVAGLEARIAGLEAQVQAARGDADRMEPRRYVPGPTESGSMTLIERFEDTRDAVGA